MHQIFSSVPFKFSVYVGFLWNIQRFNFYSHSGFFHAFTLTQGLKHEWQLGPEAKDNLLSSYAAEATANEIFVFKNHFSMVKLCGWILFPIYSIAAFLHFHCVGPSIIYISLD